MKHTGIKFGNILSCKCLVQTLAAVTLVSNTAFAVNDGETIAWFPLDGDFLSAVNAAGNGEATLHTPEGGSATFVSYADSHSILDASGNVARESKYVTMDTSRVYIPLSGFDLGSDVTSVTVEAFLRGDGRGANSVAEVRQWDEVFWMGRVGQWNQYQSQGTYAPLDSTSLLFSFQDMDDANGKAQLNVRKNIQDTAQTWFDGAWHHMAVTIEENGSGGSTARIYKDYALVNTLTIGTYWRGAENQFYIALGGRSGKSKLDFDEIRITKGLLQPTQFLCFNAKGNPQSGDALLYMPFDGDMASVAGGLYNEFGGTTTGTPVYDSSVWKDFVCEYGNKDALVREGKNLSSLKADHAAITKTIRNPHMTTNALGSATIEFFIKGSSNAGDVTAWNEVLFFGKGWAEEAGKDKFGFLVQADQNKKYYLRVDTGAATGYASSATTPFAMTDGKWHHVAITIEPADGGTRTRISYSFDYADPVTQTKDGAWVGLKNGKNFSFGASGSVLWLDEFRVTKGVLPKAKFLRARSEAATVISLR